MHPNSPNNSVTDASMDYGLALYNSLHDMYLSMVEGAVGTIGASDRVGNVGIQLIESRLTALVFYFCNLSQTRNYLHQTQPQPSPPPSPKPNLPSSSEPPMKKAKTTPKSPKPTPKATEAGPSKKKGKTTPKSPKAMNKPEPEARKP
ncbi:hypothetical protein Leryth_012497 [Lithospermum erythrorhizon]|nr:hypothetical protein Leryth_012497 [Lithospermum erythrorhizon]